MNLEHVTICALIYTPRQGFSLYVFVFWNSEFELYQLASRCLARVWTVWTVLKGIHHT